MTTNHPVRRLLARVCSTDTMARIVDPTLADMRVEGASWRAWLALTRALALHAVMSMPGAAARVWRDDGHALPRAAFVCASTAILLAAPLVAAPAQSAARLSWLAVLFLVPQALAVALPPSLLIGIPVAFRHVTSTRRLIARGVLLSALCATATAGVILCLVPDASQGFRVEAARRLGAERVNLAPGPIEMSQHDLRDRIDVLELTPGGVRAARRFAYVYHLKYALGAIALPLGIVAIALARSGHGRRRPILLGAMCVIAYILAMFPLASAAELLMGRYPALPAGLFAWLPTAVVLLIAAAVSRLAPRPAAPACA
jgi:hypothetical protein